MLLCCGSLPSISIFSVISLICILYGEVEAYVLLPSSLEAFTSIYKVNYNGTNTTESLDWYNPLLEKYIEKRKQSAVYEDLSIENLRKKTAENLTKKLFNPRRTALEKLVESAETVAKNYDWKTPVKYVDFKSAWDFDAKYAPVEEDERAKRFPKPVNFHHSAVHVPAESYVGNHSQEYEMLQGLDWTNGLDEHFVKAENDSNSKDDQEPYMWMYFGSSLGFVRHYPANQWQVESSGSPFQDLDVDLYDSRRTPWYNQASNSPKDVLIMIDTSGSTVGQTSYLMTLTVQKLLDTLGEDDFFQVANFSDIKRRDLKETGRIGPSCFPEFIQATSFNKRVIMDAVKFNRVNGSPKGQADFAWALKYAFEEFLTHKKNADTKRYKRQAHCTNTIIILTDGGVEEPHDIIFEYTKENVTDSTPYRIFTYAMGKTPTPLNAVKWLACANKGYYSKINSMNTINTGVQHYTARLSATLAHQEGQNSALSSIYKDYWDYTHVLPRSVSYEASQGIDRLSTLRWSHPDPQMGLGMLTTLTMPVFNRTDEANVTLLGVMGFDISLDEFDKFIPYSELGPLSYTFMINHNGFAVKHPELRPQAAWNNEPPSIDILDLEVVKNEAGTKKIAEIRQEMLDKKSSKVEVPGGGLVFSNGEDNHGYFISFEKKDYYTYNIADTAYRLAMAHPLLGDKILKVTFEGGNKPDPKVFNQLAAEDYDVTLAKWSYCDGVMWLYNQSEVLDGITNLTNSSSIKCNEDYVNHLLMDVQLVLDMNLTDSVSEGALESVSLTTAGGLSVTYPIPDTNEKSNFRLESNFFNPVTKRAYATPNDFVYAAEYATGPTEIPENKTGPSVSVYKALSDQEGGPYIFGVVGVTMDNSRLTEMMENIEDEEGNKLCQTGSEETSCYLLDEGGFIISENVHAEGFSHIGQWIGVVDTSLMNALHNETDDSQSIYHKHKHYDHQAVCRYDWLSETSSAPRLPSLGQVAEMLMTQLTTGVVLLYNSLLSVEPVEAAERLQYGEEFVACVSVSYQYHYTDKDAEFNKTINFSHEGCDREVLPQKIPGTNLLLVIADKPSSVCDKMPRLPQEPIKYPNGENGEEFVDETICQRHKRPRVPPSQCYSKDKKDFKYSCHGCRQASVSISLLLTAFSFYYMFT